jgi:hypothetical protein
VYWGQRQWTEQQQYDRRLESYATTQCRLVIVVVTTIKLTASQRRLRLLHRGDPGEVHDDIQEVNQGQHQKAQGGAGG